MSSNYKQEENRLKLIIKNNLKPNNLEHQIKLIIYYRTRKLKNLFIKNGPPANNDLATQHHVVYQYSCNKGGCNPTRDIYIGYTTDTLKARMIQHQSIKKHIRSVHSTGIGYKEMLDNTKILFKNESKQYLLLAEALLIKKHKPPLNSQDEGNVRILGIF